MAEGMDLDGTPPTAPDPAACSICLDPVAAAPDGARSVASLQCGHEFHLDCIGSAFNAKGIMQCPNCRNIEEGNWRNANRFQPPGFGNVLDWEAHRYLFEMWRQVSTRNVVTREELLSLVQSTIHEFTSLNPVLQNHELEPAISYGIEGDLTADLSNVQVYDGTEPRNSEVEEPHLIPLADFANGPPTPTPFGFVVPRYERRSTQPTPRSGSSAAPFGSSPGVMSTGHGGMRAHVVQQTAPPDTRSSSYPATARRIRPRALSIASSIAASYAAEDREPHDISRASAANLTNSNQSLPPDRVHHPSP